MSHVYYRSNRQWGSRRPGRSHLYGQRGGCYTSCRRTRDGQRGRGWGWLKNIGKAILPHAKSMAATLLPQVVAQVPHLLSSSRRKQALRNISSAAVKTGKNYISSKMTGSGYSRRGLQQRGRGRSRGWTASR